MPLVPLRVKGKRKRKHNPPSTSHLPRALKDRTPRSRRSLSSVLASRALRPRPRLDALPDEILEAILLLSGELSLPRASNLLGKRLSGKAALLRLFVSAFGGTWAQWFGRPTDREVVYGPWPEAEPICAGDPGFQTQVLSQPWAKIDLILQAQHLWASTHAPNAYYQHPTPLSLSTPDHPPAGPSHFNAHLCFSADYAHFSALPALSLTQPWPPSSTLQDIHPSTLIPTALLTGPWDEERRQRLFWLCRGGYRPSGAGIAWEVKIALLRALLGEMDALIANCLMGGWLFEGLPGDVVRTELAGLERRLAGGEGGTVLRYVRVAFYACLGLEGVGA